MNKRDRLHREDPTNETSNLAYHPPRGHPVPFRSNVNAFEVTLPPRGIAYWAFPDTPAGGPAPTTATPPWAPGVPGDGGDNGLGDPTRPRNASGESSGVNALGVAVSGTESIYVRPEALAADPWNPASGVNEDSAPSVLLPQVGGSVPFCFVLALGPRRVLLPQLLES